MADESLNGNSLQAFVEEADKDYQQTQRDLKEIDILIKQKRSRSRAPGPAKRPGH
ncbi:MAG: hypothetical protein M5U34_22100 [Chloroflexi bacterium]|nr:hypothetical protein [Chloroflexota bacterium]